MQAEEWENFIGVKQARFQVYPACVVAGMGKAGDVG